MCEKQPCSQVCLSFEGGLDDNYVQNQCAVGFGIFFNNDTVLGASLGRQMLGVHILGIGPSKRQWHLLYG